MNPRNKKKKIQKSNKTHLDWWFLFLSSFNIKCTDLGGMHRSKQGKDELSSPDVRISICSAKMKTMSATKHIKK